MNISRIVINARRVWDIVRNINYCHNYIVEDDVTTYNMCPGLHKIGNMDYHGNVTANEDEIPFEYKMCKKLWWCMLYDWLALLRMK